MKKTNEYGKRKYSEALAAVEKEKKITGFGKGKKYDFDKIREDMRRTGRTRTHVPGHGLITLENKPEVTTAPPPVVMPEKKEVENA